MMQHNNCLLTLFTHITLSFFLPDCKLRPDQELLGPGGDIHYSDGDTLSHRGEKSHHRTVQLCP